MKKGYLILSPFMVNCYRFSFTHSLTLSLSMKLGFRNQHSQEVLIERRFVLGFCWKENSYEILGNMKKDPVSLMLSTVTKKLHELGYVLKIYALEDGKARSMWEEIGGQISILSPDRYGHIDWSIFEGIIVNSLEAKDAISRYVRRIVFEGGLIVDPDQGEFLCPVCRGLANSALPALPGDSQKVSTPPMVSTVSWLDATGQLSSTNRETDFHRFREALSLLRSASDVAGRSEILEAFPMHRNGRIRPNPESMFRVLSGMYFPGKHDRISGSVRVSHSVIMWDTLKYSLISGSADGLLLLLLQCCYEAGCY